MISPPIVATSVMPAAIATSRWWPVMINAKLHEPAATPKNTPTARIARMCPPRPNVLCRTRCCMTRLPAKHEHQQAERGTGSSRATSRRAASSRARFFFPLRPELGDQRRDDAVHHEQRQREQRHEPARGSVDRRCRPRPRNTPTMKLSPEFTIMPVRSVSVSGIAIAITIAVATERARTVDRPGLRPRGRPPRAPS